MEKWPTGEFAEAMRGDLGTTEDRPGIPVGGDRGARGEREDARRALRRVTGSTTGSRRIDGFVGRQWRGRLMCFSPGSQAADPTCQRKGHDQMDTGLFFEHQDGWQVLQGIYDPTLGGTQNVSGSICL